MIAESQKPARAALQSDGLLVVEGDLVFDTVPDVYRQSVSQIQESAGPVRVDLSGVTRADSAGIALLVEWLRLAQSKNKQLTFVNVPEQVRSLARVNGLSAAFGIDGGV